MQSLLNCLVCRCPTRSINLKRRSFGNTASRVGLKTADTGLLSLFRRKLENGLSVLYLSCVGSEISLLHFVFVYLVELHMTFTPSASYFICINRKFGILLSLV